MSKTLGQVAYEKWAELVPSNLGTWEQLPASGQAGWQEIAEAAVNRHIEECEELGRNSE